MGPGICRGFHIFYVIADHPGCVQVCLMVVSSVEKGGGQRFATHACFVRGMRAHIGFDNVDASFVQVREQAAMEDLIIFHPENSSPQPALVGHDRHPVPGVPKSLQRFDCTGDQSIVLQLVAIVDLFDQGPVSIQKDKGLFFDLFRRLHGQLLSFLRFILYAKRREMKKAEEKGHGHSGNVTVYAASSRNSPESFLAAGRAVGRGLAERGHVLIYGGASVGVMGALATGALEAGGRVEGVILDEFSSVAHGQLHSLETVTDMRSRKAGLADRGDVYIALPGALGTLEEISEILVERQLSFHRKPILLLNLDGFWDHLLAFFDRMAADGILTPENRQLPTVCADVPEVLARLDVHFEESAAGVSRG